MRVEKPWAHSLRLPPGGTRLELLHLNRLKVKGTGLPWSRGSFPAPDYKDSADLQASIEVEVSKDTCGDRVFLNSQHVRGVALFLVAQFVHSVEVIIERGACRLPSLVCQGVALKHHHQHAVGDAAGDDVPVLETPMTQPAEALGFCLLVQLH